MVIIWLPKTRGFQIMLTKIKKLSQSLQITSTKTNTLSVFKQKIQNIESEVESNERNLL
jgi:hypothetical protein